MITPEQFQEIGETLLPLLHAKVGHRRKQLMPDKFRRSKRRLCKHRLCKHRL